MDLRTTLKSKISAIDDGIHSFNTDSDIDRACSKVTAMRIVAAGDLKVGFHFDWL